MGHHVALSTNNRVLTMLSVALWLGYAVFKAQLIFTLCYRNDFVGLCCSVLVSPTRAPTWPSDSLNHEELHRCVRSSTL